MKCYAPTTSDISAPPTSRCVGQTNVARRGPDPCGASAPLAEKELMRASAKARFFSGFLVLLGKTLPCAAEAKRR